MSSRLILVTLDDSLVAFRRPSYIIRYTDIRDRPKIDAVCVTLK